MGGHERRPERVKKPQQQTSLASLATRNTQHGHHLSLYRKCSLLPCCRYIPKDVPFGRRPIITSVSLPICCGKLKHKRGQSMLLCSFLDLYRCLNPMRGFVMCHLTSMLSIKDAAETQNRLHFHQISEGQINKLFTLVYKNGVRRHRR